MTAVLLNFNAIILLQSSCFDSTILYNFMVAVSAIISQWRQIHIPNAPNTTKTTQTGTYQHMSANANAFKWLESTEKNTIKVNFIAIQRDAQMHAAKSQIQLRYLVADRSEAGRRPAVVRPSLSADLSRLTMYWLLQTACCWHCTVVLQQQCDSAT